MLTLSDRRHDRNCQGLTRRELLKIGSLGFGGLITLPHLLALQSRAAAAPQILKDRTVVLLFLQGGPSHIEFFDPKLTAPSEIHSVTGEVTTNVPGITLGGTFTKCAKVADKMAFVRSFAHTNSGHGGGTHFVMTGYDNRLADNGGLATRPAIGSIVARVRGANNAQTGIPTYVRLGGVGFDGPAFLGSAFAPFNPSGEARTPAAQKTFSESIRSAPIAAPRSSICVTRVSRRTSTPIRVRSFSARADRSSGNPGSRRSSASTRITRVVDVSIRRKSLRITLREISANAPASSTPVGPPPTMTNVSSARRRAV